MKNRRIHRALACALSLALLLGLLPTAALAAEGPVTLDVSAGSITITATGYTAGGAAQETPHTGGYVITQAGAGSPTANTISVTGGVHAVTLNGVNIDVPSTASVSAFSIAPGAEVALTLAAGTENRLTSTPLRRAGLEVPAGAALTVTAASAGALTATGADGGAGIGGGADAGGGRITINGGTVNASGGGRHSYGYGAGIGGGIGGDGGHITINGGTVDASSSYGAGSGGGSGGHITINGGTVNAFSFTGAGIGGGGIGNSGGGGAGGDIAIGGSARVAATSGIAGISSGGAGSGGDGGHIAINGGAVVEATGHVHGAGIGGGADGAGGHIAIGGSARVTATGSGGGAGIGGGYGAAGGAVAITGGVVTATGKGDDSSPGTGIGGGGAGIGGGGGYSSWSGRPATQGGSGGSAAITGGDVTATGAGGAPSVGPGTSGEGYTGDPPGFDTYIRTVALNESSTGGEGTPTHSLLPGEDGNFTVTGAVELPCGLTVPDGRTLTVPAGAALTVPAGVTLLNNGAIDGGGTLAGGGVFGGAGTYTLRAEPIGGAAADITAPAAGAAPDTAPEVVDVRYTAEAVTWTAGGTAHDGNFDYETAYTVSITLTAADGYRFADDVAGAINGAPADVTRDGDKITLSRTFDPVYPVTVNGGTASPASAVEGASVMLGAVVPSSQRFTGWTITPDVTFTSGGKNIETATFTMPAQAVTATASFESQSSGGSGGDGSSDDDTPSPTEQAVSKVEKAKDGDTVKLDLPYSGKLPGKVLEAAAGKDITLEIDAGKGVTWVIKGLDIPKGKLADLDLKADAKAGTIPATVINTLTGEKNVMQLELRHNGPFGFPLTLRLEVGKDSAGLWANLYYYDEAAKTLDYQAAAKIGADGKADIPFSHASNYAIVIDAASHGKTNPNTGGGNPFTDVKDTDWFFNAVMYVYHGGIMQGTSATTFSPNGGTTRAQLAVILWRMEGSPAPTGGNPFSDVPEGAYYTEAVAWCAGAELVGGYGGGLFGPGDPISREQLASLLYRYAVYKGWDVSMGEDTNILSYADAFDVSEWAIPAVQWACGAGIMGGTTDNRLAPQAGATRAQIAAMLMRLLEQYAPGSGG